jgi:2',3'-cyclic-nucleotide 2'-phosphodiesterase (5'-nucleotidase family)
MPRHRIILLVATTMILASVVALSYRPSWNGTDLTIFFTANTSAQLEPCFCTANRTGGLPRRATYIRANTPADAAILLIEGGDALGRDTELGRIQSRHLFRCFEAIGYRVLGVGPRDLAYGTKYLRSVEKLHGITFTSANVIGSRGHVFPQSATVRTGVGRALGVEFGGITAAIVSVIGSDEALPQTDPDSLRIVDAAASATSAVANARKASDLVVLLAHANPAMVRQLVHESGADVVIATRVTRNYGPHDNVGLVDGVVLGFVSYQARSIGVAHLTLVDGQIAAVRGDLEPLGSTIADDPAIASVVQDARREETELHRRLQRSSGSIGFRKQQETQ